MITIIIQILFNKMNILMILLGCNIYSILLNRLETSFMFIETNANIIQEQNITLFSTQDNLFQKNKTKITWFLSGGIKTNIVGAKSEASIMKSQIDNIIDLKYEKNKKKKKNSNFNSNFNSNLIWDYVLDEKSTNTAENFIWASHFLNTTEQVFDVVYVVTSAFHYLRAKKMLNLIDTSKNFKWILGDLEEKDSRYWESIHIKNVATDVFKAKRQLETFYK